MRSLRHIPGLAVRDFLHEGALSACVVIGLAAVLAPLLVLFGLKFGLIDTLEKRLVEDPRSRELILVGTGQFTRAWIEDLRRRPDVLFAIPETRRLSAAFNWLENPSTGAQVTGVGMVPTGFGEPLLETRQLPTSDVEIVLSARAAQRLGVGQGDSVRAVVQRINGEATETVVVELTVVDVVPEAVLAGDSSFVPLGLLIAVEDFRDGFGNTRLGWSGDPPTTEERVFARFRLYARSIYEVAALSNALIVQGVEVRSRAAEVELMQVLDSSLSRVFWTVAALGSGGFLASLSASLVAAVERKRRDLGILRLLGFSGSAIVAFPLVQALLIVALGSALAATGYFIVSSTLNAYFADSLRLNEFVCRLMPWHLAIAGGTTVICALVAALWAGSKAARIQPAEVIRDA
jgi:putative ABC transport system permease protein